MCSPDIRLRYGKRRHIHDRQAGHPCDAMRRISCQMLWAPYCGSCMASPTRSYSDGLTSSGARAFRRPGMSASGTSGASSSPFSLIRTSVPSALMSFAVCGPAYESNVVPRHQQLRAKKRAVRRAKYENLVSHCPALSLFLVLILPMIFGGVSGWHGCRNFTLAIGINSADLPLSNFRVYVLLCYVV